MSPISKALLVFCEGSHDVVFVRQVLEVFFGFSRVEWKFSQFPAPFNQLFRTNVEEHAAKDLDLNMAHKFFLPDRVLVKRDQMALLFKSGGKEEVGSIKTFLSSFLPLLKNANIFQQDAPSAITKARYLLVYDADHMGVQGTINNAKRNFAEISGLPWLEQDLTMDDINQCTAYVEDKAVCVWCAGTEFGTLEDILFPMFERCESEGIEKASNIIDLICTWQINSECKQTAVAEIAKRKKSIITTLGQRKKPGGSMHVIIDQGKLISKTVFKDDAHVRAFAVFLSKFIELPIEAE